MTPPRVAFCFHDPFPTGASVWLRDFILGGTIPRDRALVVLPAASEMEPTFRDAGHEMAVLNFVIGDLSKSGPGRVAAMAANRLRGVADYCALFRRWKPDVVYVNSSYQIAPMIAAKLTGFPLFVHVREGWRSGRTHGLKSFVIRHAAATVAFDASEGMRLFGPPRPGHTWEVSPNGVDPAFADLHLQRDALRERFGFLPGETVILFLGSLSRRKGLHDLLAIWPDVRRSHPQTRLAIAGVADQFETDPAIRAFPTAPPEGCDYLGFRKDAPQLLAAADAFVLPSYGEAMPISISEAMMVGTPVVARAVGDVEWQVGEGRGYLFRGDGPEPLRAALGELLANPADAATRAAKAKAFAREKLTNTRQRAQILRLLEEARDMG